jgi:type II secretory pathway component PulC
MPSARPSRRLLLVLTLCASIAAAAIWTIARREQPPAPTAAAPAPAAAPPREAFAPAPAATEPAAPPEPDAPPEIPHTQLPLLLLATVVDGDPALSLATILDTQRTAPAVMGEGEQFEGRAKVRLAAIERERVLIDNDGAREQLVFAHAALASAEVPALELAPEERERRRALAQRVRELTEHGSDALRSARGGLLAEGDVRAVYDEDGELVGVHVDGIREGGLYDRIGLHEGDVVTKINGIPVSDDPTAIAQLAAQAASSEVLELTVDPPDGPPTTVALPTAELERLDAPGAGTAPE